MDICLKKDTGNAELIVGNISDSRVNLSGGNIPLNTWKHVAGTWNTSNMYLYVDGAQVGTNESPTGGAYPYYLSYIASDVLVAQDYFNGTIDDVVIFNRALDLNEVRSLYNASKYQYYHNFTNLVASSQHNFTGFVVYKNGVRYQTEERQVTIT